MFLKFLKLLLFLTVFVEAAPKLFNSYGTQMEDFKKDCVKYNKSSKIPTQIKKKCKKYISATNKAFKYGYKFDKSVDNDSVNLDKAEKYNELLHELEEKSDLILSLIHGEMKKAINGSDLKYFTLLLDNSKIKIYLSEYEFMDKNKQIFSENKQYIEYKKDLETKEKLRLEKEQKHKDMKACSDMSNELADIYISAIDQIKQGDTLKGNKTYRIALSKKETFLSACNNKKHKVRIANGLSDADVILKKNADVIKERAIKFKAALAKSEKEHARKKEREEKARQARDERLIQEKKQMQIPSKFKLIGGYFACMTEELFSEASRAASNKDNFAIGILLSKGCVLTKKGVRFSFISHESFGVVKIRAYSGTDSVILYTNFENIPKQ